MVIVRKALFASLLLISVVAVLHGQQPQEVSMVQLIATPSAFDGKLIRVVGFLRLEFEHTVVYIHKEDSEHDINFNGIWVDLGDGQKKPKPVADMQYVVIEGVFEAKYPGYMGMSGGSITKVSRIEPWPRTARPAQAVR